MNLDLYHEEGRHYTVDQGTGCWVWGGGKDKDGYPITSWRNLSVRGHRLFYRAYVGEIPEGHVVHHECRNKACVNPAHLRAVTHTEHHQLDIESYTGPRRKGWRFKQMTPGERQHVLDLLALGWTPRQVAAAVGRVPGTIYYARKKAQAAA